MTRVLLSFGVGLALLFALFGLAPLIGWAFGYGPRTTPFVLLIFAVPFAGFAGFMVWSIGDALVGSQG